MEQNANQIEFGEMLKKKREEKGMTQQTLADKLFVTRQAVSRWECGARYPDLMTTKRIAHELETSIDELVSGEEYHRDVEKEQVLTTPISAFIQTAFYAVCFMPYLFMSIFGIKSLFPDERLANTPAGQITILGIITVLTYIIKMLAMGCGLYFSVGGKLTPPRIAAIMSVSYVLEILLFIATFINMLIKQNGSLAWDAWLTPLYQLITIVIICGFFLGKHKIKVLWVYAATVIPTLELLYALWYRFKYYTTDLGFVTFTVHFTGKLAMIFLLVFQAYSLNKKRKLVKNN